MNTRFTLEEHERTAPLARVYLCGDVSEDEEIHHPASRFALGEVPRQRTGWHRRRSQWR